MGIIYWLLCLMVGVATGYWVWRRDKLGRQKVKWLPAVLRGLSAAIILALLIAPIISLVSHNKQKPVVVWFQDNSHSIALGLKQDTHKYLNAKSKLTNQLNSEYDLVEWQFGAQAKQGNQTDFREQTTNLQQSLSQIYQRYKGANLGAIVLATDGIYNEGHDPVYSLSNWEVPIYTIGLGDTQRQKDIGVLRVFANKVVMSGNTFEVAADIRFTSFNGTQHAVQLSQGSSIIQQKTIFVTSEDETAAVSFEVKAGAPGLVRYSISVPEAEGERTYLNNTLDFYVQIVNNEVKVLVLNSGVHPDLGMIGNALKTTAGYVIDIAPPNTLPSNWKEYHSIIAHQPSLSASIWGQIVESGKPVWHILGNNVGREHLNALKSIGTAEVGRPGIFVSPVYETGFSAFLLPLSTEAILSKLPPLETNIRAFKPSATATTLIRTREQKFPMWLVQAGTKAPMAVTIGEGLWRWAVYEYKDNKSQQVSQELVRQTMRSLNIPRQDRPFQVFLSKRMVTNQENISFTAELRNKTGELVNTVPVKLVIEDSAGTRKEFEMEPFGSAYQLVLPAMGEGIYHYLGTTNYEGNTYTDQGTFAVENIPLEQLSLQADFGLLYQLANQTGGNFYTIEEMDRLQEDLKANEQIVTKIVTEQKKEPLIEFKWLFGLLLLLLSAEWAFRKYQGMM